MEDVSGTLTSLGHNLIGRTSGSSGWLASDLQDASPFDIQLGPLQDNSGPVPTMALLPASIAIDAGDDAVLSPPYSLTTDARGFVRRTSDHVDIGAYEFRYYHASGDHRQRQWRRIVARRHRPREPIGPHPLRADSAGDHPADQRPFGFAPVQRNAGFLACSAPSPIHVLLTRKPAHHTRKERTEKDRVSLFAGFWRMTGWIQ